MRSPFRSFRTMAPVVVAAAVAVATAGCARAQSPATVGPSGTGRVVQVTPADDGTTVSLHTGDTLRVLVGAPLGQSPLGWKVHDYPRGILQSIPEPKGSNRFEFVANAPGRG